MIQERQIVYICGMATSISVTLVFVSPYNNRLVIVQNVALASRMPPSNELGIAGNVYRQLSDRDATFVLHACHPVIVTV